MQSLLILSLLSTIITPLNDASKAPRGVDTLVIYNWQDYINEGLDEDGNKVTTSLLEDFESWYKIEYGNDIKITYNTFETNETMLNNLRTGKTQYDLVCPSDYALQKMIKEDMLIKLDVDENNQYTNVENYNQYGSPYIKNLFIEKGWNEYSIPYMWGTMGLMYDPSVVNEEDVSSWNVMWDTNYQKKISIKDSVRDTYFTGVLRAYMDELEVIMADYESSKISVEEYNAKITEIFNRCDDETLELVEIELKALKRNIYGLEVDSGKNDIVTGKIAMNLAWSGDAVYSLDLAETENNKHLKYSVPKEGSNIWFDAWAMPKGANKKTAQAFLNFLSIPEYAAKNMEYIGYTSVIAGDEILALVKDWYYEEDGEYSVDLGYFFEGTLKGEDQDTVIKVSELNRQFSAQYPSEETIARCAIMEDFGDQTNKVLTMWESFKSNTISPMVYVSVTIMFGTLIFGYVFFKVKKYRNKKRRLERYKNNKANI